MYRLIIAFFLIIAFCAQGLQAQSYFTQGTEFWVAFLRNLPNTSTPNQHLLVLTNNQAAAVDGTASMPSGQWEEAFTIPANSSIEITVPLQFAEPNTSGAIENRGIRILADAPINAYAYNLNTAGSSDGTMVMPFETLADQYTIVTYTESYSTLSNNSESSFVVVATEDETEVEITPSALLRGGFPAGVPFTITLDAGQSAWFRSASAPTQAVDVTGTQIQVLGGCKNIAVFGGHEAARVGNCDYYDHLYSQMIPDQTWGTEYLLPNLREASETRYRIYAPTAGTVVTINGVQHAFPRPNGSSILDTNLVSNSTFNPSNTYLLTSTEPVSVAQLSLGAVCLSNDNADPLLITLLPTDRMLATDAQVYTLNFADASVSSRSYITVLVPDAETGSVQLDGNPIGGWQQVLTQYPGGTPTGYSARNLDPAQSLSTLTSSGMLAYAYGYIASGLGTQNAYGYMVAGGFATVPPPRLTVTEVVDNTCFGKGEGAATILVEHGAPPFTVRVDSIAAGDTTLIQTFTLAAAEAFTISDLYSFPYTVEVADIACEKTVTVQPDQPAQINLGSPLAICRSETTVDLPEATPEGGTWSGDAVVPGTAVFSMDLQEMVDPLAETTWVYYTTVPNCMDSLQVRFRDDCERLYAPNVFTPNGDGVNDYWRPDLPDVAVYRLSIYNRYGELVFSSTNPDERWFGEYKGGKAPEGVYFWTLSGSFSSGIPFERHGSLTLLR